MGILQKVKSWRRIKRIIKSGREFDAPTLPKEEYRQYQDRFVYTNAFVVRHRDPQTLFNKLHGILVTDKNRYDLDVPVKIFTDKSTNAAVVTIFFKSLVCLVDRCFTRELIILSEDGIKLTSRKLDFPINKGDEFKASYTSHLSGIES